MEKAFDTEYESAKNKFEKNVEMFKRMAKIKAVGKELGNMKVSLDKLGTDFYDKDLEELQAKVKEVEQIVGKKRKTSVVNGNAVDT